MNEKTKGMIIAGVAASSAIDKVGERMSIEDVDISILESGEATINSEHAKQGVDGAFGQETLGKIIYARKIFKKSDCETELQRKYWDKIELPFLFIMARLYDAAGHEAARSVAAQIRDHQANGEKILCRFSIEGSRLGPPDEHGNIGPTIATKVSLTLKPCNTTCDTELIEDPQAPEGWETQINPGELKVLKFEDPTRQRLSSYESDLDPVVKSEEDLVLIEPVTLAQVGENIKLLKKALEAGQMAAPAGATQGAALAMEVVGPKKRPRTKVDLRTKASPEAKSVYMELQKAEIEGLDYLAKSAPECHYFARQPTLVQGRLATNRALYSILFEDANYYYIVQTDKFGQHTWGDLAKIAKNSNTYRLISRPYALLAP